MSCVPWQSLQAAAPLVVEARRAGACTLVSYCAAAASWQVAHSTGASFSACGKSVVFARSAWQPTHAIPDWPWIEAPNLSARPRSSDPLAPVADGSPWQARQSSLVGGFGGGVRLRGGGRKQQPGRTATSALRKPYFAPGFVPALISSMFLTPSPSESSASSAA